MWKGMALIGLMSRTSHVNGLSIISSESSPHGCGSWMLLSACGEKTKFIETLAVIHPSSHVDMIEYGNSDKF